MSAGQSRLGSALESVANVAVGWGVALAAQIIVLPWFGVNLAMADNLAISAIFTVISFVRSLVIRRLFNRIQGRA